MRQRLDIAHSRSRRASVVPMMVVPAAASPPLPVVVEPVVKPAPHAGMLNGMLNSIM
jgi:hypothetical protein